MTSAPFQRAMILYQQGRHADAERELRGAIGEQPHDPVPHAMLALCLAQRQAYHEAHREAVEAIRLGPDQPFPHYAMAIVMLRRNRFDEAEHAIREAIRLDPYDADFFGVLGSIKLETRNWIRALEAAEEGLKLDPAHVTCTNVRATALVHLGRHDEASSTMGQALERAPEDAPTHANQGWALLHRGEHVKAMEHFREALRLDPTNDWARSGIVEALKARNVVYRWMLAYFLWMSRLSDRAQWGVIIGGYVAFRVMRSVSRDNPQAAPYLMPFIILYAIFAIMTWLAYPLFNLLLRLNKFGRLALSREQIVMSNWIGVALGLGLIALIAATLTRDEAYLLLALVFGLLAIPTSGTFTCARGWPRTTMALVTLGLAVLGIGGAGTLLAVSRGAAGGAALKPASTMLSVFFVGVLLSQFGANALRSVRPKV
jgi:Flp pilus assembly protein TadD